MEEESKNKIYRIMFGSFCILFFIILLIGSCFGIVELLNNSSEKLNIFYLSLFLYLMLNIINDLRKTFEFIFGGNKNGNE